MAAPQLQAVFPPLKFFVFASWFCYKFVVFACPMSILRFSFYILLYRGIAMGVLYFYCQIERKKMKEMLPFSYYIQACCFCFLCICVFCFKSWIVVLTAMTKSACFLLYVSNVNYEFVIFMLYISHSTSKSVSMWFISMNLQQC